MNSVSRVVLVLTLALTLSACGGYHHRHHPPGSMGVSAEQIEADVAALVTRVVQDPAKTEEVSTRLRQIVAEAMASRQQNRQFHQALYELNRRHDAPPEEFLKIIDEMNARRMQAATTILRLRFEIKERMTETEWAAFTEGMEDLRGYRREGDSKK